MLPSVRTGFEIDSRLENATKPLVWLGLCEVRLHSDARWPWAVLVPQRPGVTEIHELTPLDQTLLTFEVNMVSASMKKLTGCDKINIGALGNVVPQLHVHVVARFRNDTSWPDPVWGVEGAAPYESGACQEFISRLRSDLLAASG